MLILVEYMWESDPEEGGGGRGKFINKPLGSINNLADEPGSVMILTNTTRDDRWVLSKFHRNLSKTPAEFTRRIWVQKCDISQLDIKHVISHN